MAAPHVKTLVVACALALAASAACAQLRIGQTVGVTGAVAATVKESMQGTDGLQGARNGRKASSSARSCRRA